MTTNAAVDVRSLFSVKLASIFQTNAIEMDKLKTQLQNYGTNPVGSWQKLFANCIRAITFSSNPIERVEEYKPKFVAELQLKYSNIDDFLNNKTKNEFVVMFAETLSTILQAEEPEEPVVAKEHVPYVETDDERKKREEEDDIFRINQAAARDLENGLSQISYRKDTVGGSLPKKTPRRRKYSKRNNTRRKRTARKSRSYK